MKPNIYGITEADFFRLAPAYTAIKSPSIRVEFLRAVKVVAVEQWGAGMGEQI